MQHSLARLLVLTSGGDAPGMNAAVRAVVRTAFHHDMHVFGAEMGYRGLLSNDIRPLTPASVANCIQRGGTLLKTARCPAFKEKAAREKAIKHIRTHEIDCLVVLGGNGSFQGARHLAEEAGIPVVGIPCTIDNDIVGTDYTIGFDTACNTAITMIDKIRDTASSLDRNFMIEVMGRASGFLAVDVGIAGGAEIILIPEYPIVLDALVEKIQQKRRQKLASIIVAAESGEPGHVVELAKNIEEKCGVHYTVCTLGHTQRGGAPTRLDRKYGSIMGVTAVNALLAGATKKMVARCNNQFTMQDFPTNDQPTRFFENRALLKLNDMLCD